MTGKLVLAVLLLSTGFVLGANPLQLPEYDREVRIDFPNEEAADAAELEPLPLPEGKTFAFSTRWDDSNPKHARMAALLARHGFKGTFYLNAAGADFYRDTLPQLIANGHAIGNHTLNHPNLAATVPNEVGRQILRNRAEFEARADRPVNAFVLPYGAYRNGSDTQAPLRIGEALLRSGELGSPDFYDNLEEEYGMPSGSWAVSSLFAIDDRNPSAERFDREIEKRLTGMVPGEVRHATLGVHTWQDDKGFETLDRIFAKYAHRPNWWYCNENEYNAYRYAALHTRIAKRVDGRTAIFKLTGPTPAALGSDTPLWAKVTPAAADGKTMVALPHTLQLPEKIDLIVSAGGELAAPKKFPELAASLRLDISGRKATLTLANRGEQPLTGITVAFRLPPLVAAEETVPRRNIDLIPPGGTANVQAEFAELRKTALYQCGRWFAAAEVNFADGGKPQRLWVGAEGEFPAAAAEAVPRDTALMLGPVPASTLKPELLAAASNPDESFADWVPLEAGKWNLPCMVQIPKKADSEAAVALTFDADAPFDGWNLHLGKKDVKGVYLNGQPIEVKKLPDAISGHKGKNRLVVLYAAAGGPRLASVSSGTDPNVPVTFVRR